MHLYYYFLNSTHIVQYAHFMRREILKKQINCGAYLYNNKNGTTYFCTLVECKEIMGALEEVVVEETQGSKESKKSNKKI